MTDPAPAVDSRQTAALHHRAPADGALPAVTPLYQASAFLTGSPYFYSRKDNPNVSEFEGAVAALEGCRHAVAVSTGMAALQQAIDLLRPGDGLVFNRDIYGCSHRLFHRAAESRGLAVTALDLTDARDRARIPATTRLVVFETPTNPFLKTVPIGDVVRATRTAAPGALVAVDSTWATPWFQNPLAHGADLVLHSATKFLGGHSDVMGGVVCADDDDLARRVRDNRFYSGAVLDPHSAWLLCRSLKTFALRMREHERVTHRLAAFLAARPEVARVHTPDIDGVQLRGYGGIVFIALRADLAGRYADFAARLRLFDRGTAMACVTSMVAQPYTGSHASMTAEEKSAIGLDHGLVRLCFGFEDPADLERDLAHAFAGLAG
jgi:cystathionine gamma-lyase/cystathionine gamma-lyase/homocysteine desulfhydrase